MVECTMNNEATTFVNVYCTMKNEVCADVQAVGLILNYSLYIISFNQWLRTDQLQVACIANHETVAPGMTF